MTRAIARILTPFWLGMITTMAVIASLSLNCGGAHYRIAITDRRVFSILTGVILLFAIAWQWRLFFHRNKGSSQDERFELTAHRWVGSLLFVFLFIHATALGLNLQSLLTLSMTIAVMTGLFHIDMLKLKFARARSVWEWIHFGIAATMVPLIAIHVWSAFVFKAN
jgi:cytochrome b561